MEIRAHHILFLVIYYSLWIIDQIQTILLANHSCVEILSR